MKIKNWNEKEIEYLKKNFKTSTVKELAEKLDKSSQNVEYAIRRLGLCKQVHKKWTEEELQFLRDNYPAMTVEQLTKYVDHTVNAINTKLKILGLTRNGAWSEEDVNYLITHWEDTLYSEIAKKLGRTEGAIRAKCFELGLIKKDRWTEEEEEYLRKVYYSMPTKEIAQIMNRTHDSVHCHASKMGMKKFPYTCNYRFFENIDTEEKAYWLGFLAADGWVNKNEKTGSGTVGIELQYGDIEHLKKFNKSIEGNYQIIERWRATSGFRGQKKNNKKHHACVLRIFSIAMYNDLFALGFNGQKSYNLELPDIPDYLMRHYMRGYFDGDGCFAITYNDKNKIKKYSCSYLSASEKIIKQFEKIIHEIGIPSTKMDTYQKEGYARMWRIWVNDGDNKGRMKFLEYLYKDANIYLDRKYERYQEIKEYIESQRPRQPVMAGLSI